MAVDRGRFPDRVRDSRGQHGLITGVAQSDLRRCDVLVELDSTWRQPFASAPARKPRDHRIRIASRSGPTAPGKSCVGVRDHPRGLRPAGPQLQPTGCASARRIISPALKLAAPSRANATPSRRPAKVPPGSAGVALRQASSVKSQTELHEYALSACAQRSSGRMCAFPTATYRLQLHRGFTFAQAREIVPYLARLGISHVYASPFFRAAPGSTHGYDVCDHNELNPELGGRE